MSRIRTVKPEFWGHPKTARLPFEARLLFLALFNIADDEGLMLGSNIYLIGQVFPNDDVTPRKFESWLSKLEGERMIRRYVVEEIRYLSICGFEEHQRISHPTPSRLPKHSGDFPEPFAPDLGSSIIGGKKRPTESFTPTDAHRSYASAHGLDLDLERQQWLTHCEANGKTYSVLNAGFSTWLQKSVVFGRGKTPSAAMQRLDATDAMSRRR